jgi:hypothetical protein
VNFETDLSFEKVTFLIKDSKRNYKLEYAAEEKMENGYLIFLMSPDQENKIKFEITDLKGKKYLAVPELVFRTASLPDGEAEFPGIEITRTKPDDETDELILFNPRRRIPWGMATIINQKGDALWYYSTNSRISDFDLLENGNISYVTQDYQIVEMDLAGNIIHRW